ncbi:MAG: ATP-binding cassette domain-containing protein, partial [Pseudomonadota bacterium]
RGLARKDSDAREKIDRARVADSGAGSQLRQLGGRATQVQARLEASRIGKDYETGIWLEGSKSSRDAVLKLEAGETTFAGTRTLRWPALAIKPDERIAITGRNGIGKSTWLNYALPLLNVPQENVVFLPQELTAAAARAVMAEVRTLPKAKLGLIMNIVSRLNSRPDRLLDSQQPSPGEVRKLLLGLGMSRLPHIIVMDEPTNHLDLPSIEALEEALADCPCALLLVSHDRRFLERIGAQSWRMEADEDGNSILNTDVEHGHLTLE